MFPSLHKDINQAMGTVSAAPLDSVQAGFLLRQLMVVQTVDVLQRAVRAVAPRRNINSRLIPREQVNMSPFRGVLPRMGAPIMWRDLKGQTLVQLPGTEYYADDSTELPQLRAPLINEQWINMVNDPDYSKGF